MREYITVIAGSAILAVFADILSPQQWKKYIKIITGIVVSCVIIQPIAEIRDMDTGEVFGSFQDDIEYREYNILDDVMEEFCMNIKKDIKERVYERSGADIECDVKIKLNDEGLVESVEKVYIYGDIPDSMREEIAYVYGLEEWEVVIYGEG